MAGGYVTINIDITVYFVTTAHYSQHLFFKLRFDFALTCFKHFLFCLPASGPSEENQLNLSEATFLLNFYLVLGKQNTP